MEWETETCLRAGGEAGSVEWEGGSLELEGCDETNKRL